MMLPAVFPHRRRLRKPAHVEATLAMAGVVEPSLILFVPLFAAGRLVRGRSSPRKVHDKVFANQSFRE